jgi:hypothetical protein
MCLHTTSNTYSRRETGAGTPSNLGVNSSYVVCDCTRFAELVVDVVSTRYSTRFAYQDLWLRLILFDGVCCVRFVNITDSSNTFKTLTAAPFATWLPG